MTEPSDAPSTDAAENDASAESKAETEAEEIITEPPPPPPPRGLNALLARRRLAAGKPISNSS